MPPLIRHPLSIGTAVEFPPTTRVAARRAAVEGLRQGRLTALQGVRRYGVGVIEAVEEASLPQAFEEDGRIQRIYYQIRSADGVLERVPATQVRPTSLLEVLAESARDEPAMMPGIQDKEQRS